MSDGLWAILTGLPIFWKLAYLKARKHASLISFIACSGVGAHFHLGSTFLSRMKEPISSRGGATV